MLLVAGPRHFSSPLRHPVNSREGIQPDITYSTGHHVATTWQVYCWQHMGLSGKFILGNMWDHVAGLCLATHGFKWQVYTWQHVGPRSKFMISNTWEHVASSCLAARGATCKFMVGNTWEHVTCLYSATRGTTWQVYTRQHAGPRGKLMLGSTLHHLSKWELRGDKT